MDVLVEFSEKPVAEEIVMIAGWRQWADAGAISSALPPYLIERMGARKIGEIAAKGCYLFQIPGAHHFLRPRIKLEEGYRQELEAKSNEFFYAGDDEKGLVIFLGDEPHLRVEDYAEAFFAAVKQLNVKRVAAVGGVYGEMPFDRDRDVSCIYSQQQMKEELSNYAVRFSNYEGGSTIGSYLVDRAEAEAAEFLVFYAFVPAYDFAQPALFPQGVRIENDYKAWYDLMVRLNHMFDLPLDLSDLDRRSDQLTAAMNDKIDELEREMPQLNVQEYVDKLNTEFKEMPFVPLGDVWEEEFRDLFKDMDE
jgi:predicted ATP-grasp superfamily ATP-dependent carboligase